MRSFEDERGHTWDVALQPESYGSYRLIFARRQGRELRHALLASSTFDEAQREFAGLNEAALRERLAAAEVWGG